MIEVRWRSWRICCCEGLCVGFSARVSFIIMMPGVILVYGSYCNLKRLSLVSMYSSSSSILKKAVLISSSAIYCGDIQEILRAGFA